MDKEYKPVIIVVAFNRIKSLQRILNSLSNAHYPIDTKLIISIDNNGNNKNVADLAKSFNWNKGAKEVIFHDEHLGLRNHIIKCGDLTYNYGSVIILEDDLVVSPFFYKYAQESLTFYNGFEQIGGISLYNLPYTEALKQPFIPLRDDSDVYFKQVPSSLGQTWSLKQWDSFKKWYSENPDVKSIEQLPPKVKNWPASSWKKYYYGYLVEENRFFVFPQISFTTNFNDLGENMKTVNSMGQVRLEIVESAFRFKSLDESFNVYDAYSEILSDRLKKLQPALAEYDFEVDLYNKKESFSNDYVLTSKSCKNPLMGFARAMKPMEMNIINNISGSDLVLAKREDVTINSLNMDEFEDEYAYFYKNIFDTNILVKLISNRAKRRIKSIFKKKFNK